MPFFTMVSKSECAESVDQGCAFFRAFWWPSVKASTAWHVPCFRACAVPCLQTFHPCCRLQTYKSKADLNEHLENHLTGTIPDLQSLARDLQMTESVPNSSMGSDVLANFEQRYVNFSLFLSDF